MDAGHAPVCRVSPWDDFKFFYGPTGWDLVKTAVAVWLLAAALCVMALTLLGALWLVLHGLFGW